MSDNADFPGEVPNDPGIVPGLDSSEAALVRQPFRVVFRGYDRRQVDAAMAVVTQDGRPSFDALGQRVTEILRLAETEAEQIRAAAAADATRLRDAAARDAQELRRAAEEAVIEMRRRWAALVSELTAARDDLTTILERGRTIDLTDEKPAPAPRTHRG